MPEHEPLDYRLRCHTKRTDLPVDVLRDIGEAYAEIGRLQRERDEARREVCQLMRPDDYNEPFDGTVFEYATYRGWNCYNTPEPKVVKTLNGVIIDAVKAVPPKYEDLNDE